MSRLTEKHVQKQALEYLERYYSQKFQPPTIFSRQEVRTIEKYKKKRADGFLCFNSSHQKEHTISLEAKSHRTLGSLLPTWNDKDFYQSFIIGIVLALLAGYFFGELEWYWIAIISLTAFILGALLSMIIFALFEPDYNKSIAVIDQVHQYPANEKWVAISKDSLNLTSSKKSEFHRRNNEDNFLRVARKRGVGILVISRHQKQVLLEPSFTTGKYLDCYCIANKVRQELLN